MGHKNNKKNPAIDHNALDSNADMNDVNKLVIYDNGANANTNGEIKNI